MFLQKYFICVKIVTLQWDILSKYKSTQLKTKK